MSIRALFPFVALMLLLSACKHKKTVTATAVEPVVEAEDTLNAKCKIDKLTAKAVSKRLKENEFDFTWVSAKADVTSLVDEREDNFEIRLNIRRDSAILVSIQYVLGLQVAKVLITKDSVKFVNYIQKTYFKGDFKYINELLNADLDFELLQAVLFGNSAEFQDEESKLKPFTDRLNCKYVLSTERKSRLKAIRAGGVTPQEAIQTLTLNPENFKIIKNEFIDPVSNRRFIANYSAFTKKDSVYAPYHVDIDIVAQKNASIKIDYVRIEKNNAAKLSLSIPKSYEPLQINKKEE